MGAKKASRRSGAKKDKLWVCRGCCCGTKKKHPGVDHKALERQLREGAQQAGFRYEVTDCLGPCGQGNIAVVRRDGRIRWFRKLNDEDVTEALVEHLRTGDEPATLARHLIPKREGKKPDP